MQKLTVQRARRMAYRLVAAQLAVTGVAAALFGAALGGMAALSALIGGGVNTIGTYYQVRISFSPRTAGDANRVANAFYLGEAVKILVVVALLALALNWLTLSPAPLFVAFIATLMVYFAALLVTAGRGTGHNNG